MPQWGYAVVGFLTVSLLNACGSATPPLLQGAIKVDQAANPDLNGRASPVVVRVYELRSPAAFSGADFLSLFEKESEALAGDLVGREEYSRARRRPTVPTTARARHEVHRSGGGIPGLGPLSLAAGGAEFAGRAADHDRDRHRSTCRYSDGRLGGGFFLTKLLPSKDSKAPSKDSCWARRTSW